MANLLASLSTAARSMKAYETALTVIQNNVTNAKTPGYVKQEVDFIALAFQPDLELSGGVDVGGLVNNRSIFSEQAVWQQSSKHGRMEQLANGLGQIEPLFDITSESGVASAIDDLYAAFSRLSVAPNDIPARQSVVKQAEEVAQVFNFTAKSLAQAEDQSRREFTGIVDKINGLAESISRLNDEFRRDYRKREDAGLQAQMYSALEELSGLTDYTMLPQVDGTVTVLLGGQTPLVMGDRAFEIGADTSGQTVALIDYAGKDVTAQVQQGKLAGALELSNEKLPEYSAELNRLAEALATTFNTGLAAGLDLNGLPPATDLFEFDAANGAALTLQVTGITPEEIAAATVLEPGGNGNALLLAELSTSEEIDGFTLTEFFGKLGATVGTDVAKAQEGEISSSLLASQARNLRDQASAVDLNEEAALLLEYQQAYQAMAQLIQVINELTQVTMSILQ